MPGEETQIILREVNRGESLRLISNSQGPSTSVIIGRRTKVHTDRRRTWSFRGQYYLVYAQRKLSNCDGHEDTCNDHVLHREGVYPVTPRGQRRVK